MAGAQNRLHIVEKLRLGRFAFVGKLVAMPRLYPQRETPRFLRSDMVLSYSTTNQGLQLTASRGDKAAQLCPTR